MTMTKGPVAGGRAPLPRLTYSVREAAALLGVGAASLYRAINRGEIPTIRIGRRRLITVQWVHDLIASAA